MVVQRCRLHAVQLGLEHGHHSQPAQRCWIYKVLDTTLLIYASEENKALVDTRLQNLLIQASAISRATAQKSEFHILAISYLEEPV